MCLSVFAPMRYLHRAMTGFAVLVFLVTTSAHAQQPSDEACKLLQPAEIESALGGKNLKFSGVTNNVQGMTQNVCIVDIKKPGQTGALVITIHIATNLPYDGDYGIRASIKGAAREGQWKVKGAQFEEKTVGNAMCTMSGRPNVPVHTVCSIPRGKGYVQVDMQARTLKELASMDAVGALVQKAYTRW